MRLALADCRLREGSGTSGSGAPLTQGSAVCTGLLAAASCGEYRPGLNWLHRYKFRFYRPAISAVELFDRKIAVDRMAFDYGLHRRLVTLGADVVEIEVQRHRALVSRWANRGHSKGSRSV